MDKKNTRPPIITVLGHVDHGKTTLLDAIRKSNVAGREAGGITQSIGASKITFTSEAGKDKSIVFIDTPGHAAFTKMRGRGANVADIALLVVGADDGVKPQTKEALELIREAKIPFIVVATKTDLPSADTETVYSELEKEGVLFEGRGGDTPLVAVSAKKNEGIDKLLEMISLLAEVQGIKGSSKDGLEAIVIETSKSKGGAQAAVVVRAGKLSVGELVYAGQTPTKIKALFDFQGKSVREIPAGEPALILGFEEIPQVGTKLTGQPDEKDAGIVSPKRIAGGKLAKDEIAVFLKTQNQGALEALLTSLPPKVVVINASVGDVTSSDVLAAKASGALIFSFESKVPNDVGGLAGNEGVRIEKFEIIYELIQRLEEILKKGLTIITGRAEVLASFPFNNQKVAGCKMVEGKFAKGDTLTLVRGEKEMGKAKVISMKKQKQEIAEAKAGEEFGVVMVPQLDFQIGDMLLSATNG